MFLAPATGCHCESRTSTNHCKTCKENATFNASLSELSSLSFRLHFWSFRLHRSTSFLLSLSKSISFSMSLANFGIESIQSLFRVSNSSQIFLLTLHRIFNLRLLLQKFIALRGSLLQLFLRGFKSFLSTIQLGLSFSTLLLQISSLSLEFCNLSFLLFETLCNFASNLLCFFHLGVQSIYFVLTFHLLLSCVFISICEQINSVLKMFLCRFIIFF